MALLDTPDVAFGTPAPDFSLKTPDGTIVTLKDVAGPNGLLVAFVCNHCPYVIAIAKRLGGDAEVLKKNGIGVVAIMANDYQKFPADAPAKMGPFALGNGWDFSYLVDEDQSVARAYGAVCTPDFFGYNAELELQYRGRLDSSAMGDAANRDPELVNAMIGIAQTGVGPANQTPSMGCSIKWR